jgi:4-amino-4-deoxy-L-arabinose transferase-like glycosyltransferase
VTSPHLPWVVLALGLLARLVVGAQFPLLADEAYYWTWSRDLAAGYFDHPPVLAWCIAAGTALLGDTTLGVRLVPILLGTVTGAALTSAAHRMAGDTAALIAALLITLIPLASAGYILATPDAPLLAGIAVTWWAIVHALDSDRPTTYWLIAGVAIGVAMASKFTGVLIPISLAIACLALPSFRWLLKAPGPYVAVVTASLVMAPVLWWNANHDWVTFRFQLAHGLGTPPDASLGATLGRVGALLGGQLGLTGIILGVLFVGAIVRARRAEHGPTQQLLALSAVLCFGFFVYSAMRKPVEANWPAIAYPALVLVLATCGARGFARRALPLGLSLAATLTLVVYLYAAGIIPAADVRAGRDPFNKAFGWDGLAAAMDSVANAAATQQLPTLHLVANRYQDAAELAFHAAGQPFVPALNVASRPNHFDYWPGFAQRAALGDGMLMALDTLPRAQVIVDSLRPHFKNAEDLGVVPLTRGDRIIAWRRLWRFTNWRGSWLTRQLAPP